MGQKKKPKTHMKKRKQKNKVALSVHTLPSLCQRKSEDLSTLLATVGKDRTASNTFNDLRRSVIY